MILLVHSLRILISRFSVLVLLCGRIQAEHVDVVRERVEFIIDKREGDYRYGLGQVVCMKEKKLLGHP
jgi:hypothetical protein